jgi:hypothetical protein
METYSIFIMLILRFFSLKHTRPFLVIICKPLCFLAPTDLLIPSNICTLSVPYDDSSFAIFMFMFSLTSLGSHKRICMRSSSGFSLNVLKSSNNLSLGMLGCSLLLHFSIISRIPENYSISIFLFTS